MKKRIGIDELQPGMLVEKLDRSWLDTPFFRHKMTISSHQQIAQLKACGVRTLIINIDTKGIAEAPALEPNIADDSAASTRPSIWTKREHKRCDQRDSYLQPVSRVYRIFRQPQKSSPTQR